MSQTWSNNRIAIHKGLPIFIAAVNMRAGITVMNPLIPILRDEYHLNSVQLSFLTSLPVLCFAASAFLMPLASRIGSTNRIIATSLSVLTAAMIIRASGNLATLYISSLAVGIAIAILNFVLPVWVKEHAPQYSGLITGIYIATMGVFAALSMAVAVPLAEATGFGWRLAMLPWIVLGMISALWWIITNRRDKSAKPLEISQTFHRALLKDIGAWSIAVFFGLQSMLFYGTATWLPTIFVSKGFTLSHAGLLVSITGFIGSIIGIVAPHYASKIADLRPLLLVISGAVVLSFSALIFDHGWHLVIWLTIANICMSTTFPIAMLLTVTRSADASETRSLSIMSQFIGYVMAAAAPGILGAIFDITGNWNLALLVPAGIGILLAGVSLIAGRPEKIEIEK
jgi:CP family cyanate transporter-like MFS transporter